MKKTVVQQARERGRHRQPHNKATTQDMVSAGSFGHLDCVGQTDAHHHYFSGGAHHQSSPPHLRCSHCQAQPASHIHPLTLLYIPQTTAALPHTPGHAPDTQPVRLFTPSVHRTAVSESSIADLGKEGRCCCQAHCSHLSMHVTTTQSHKGRTPHADVPTRISALQIISTCAVMPPATSVQLNIAWLHGDH
jgi:hypothetical protein